MLTTEQAQMRAADIVALATAAGADAADAVFAADTALHHQDLIQSMFVDAHLARNPSLPQSHPVHARPPHRSHFVQVVYYSLDLLQRSQPWLCAGQVSSRSPGLDHRTAVGLQDSSV